MAVHTHVDVIDIPEDVKIEIIENRIVRVSGPKGNIEKSFKKSPVHISIEDNKIRIEVRWKGKRGYALLNTIKGIIKNMFIGVTKGYIYKLKAYYIHFPMDVYVDDSYLIIKNFVGERGIRRARIVDGVKVEVVKKGGDIDIIVKGIDKEAVGQTAANIMNATKVKSKDPRVFLDGIYLYDKGVENG